jgi:triacylglycerol lipase
VSDRRRTGTAAEAAEHTGPLHHVRRMARDLLSPRSAQGLAREAWGLATHLALYPAGLRRAPLQAHPVPRTDALDVPIVMVHGYFHNRSGFFFLGRALRQAGFRWVYGMNYNPLGETIPSLAARLAVHVEDVLDASGAPRVHVVGHSLGGLVARWYIQELGGHEQVDHCVTIGTPHHGTYAAFFGLGQTAREMRPDSSLLRRLDASLGSTPTKFVNLYSDLDVLIVPPSSAVLPESDTVHNHLIHDLGHTSLLISPELIELVAEHLATTKVDMPLAEVRTLPRRDAGATGTASAT